MKVELMYSIHYLPHPWDKKAREDGVKVYCLCREVRLPLEPGFIKGHPISWEPVAGFSYNSEAATFERFCHAQVSGIEISHGMKELIDAEKGLSESRSGK